MNLLRIRSRRHAPRALAPSCGSAASPPARRRSAWVTLHASSDRVVRRERCAAAVVFFGAVPLAAGVLVASAPRAANAAGPSVVSVASITGASAGSSSIAGGDALAGPSAGSSVPPGADMSGCSNRAVSSNFHEPLFDRATPEPVLPLEPLPADAVSVPTWSASFTTDGTSYPFTMVGTDPAAGSVATHVPVEIIPLRLDFPGSGCVLADDDMAADLEASPLFAPTALPAGDTQWLDNYQRSNFWSTVSTVSPGYHLLLDPSVAPAVTLHVPASQGITVFDPFNNRFQALVGDDWFHHQIEGLMNSLRVSPTTLAVFVPYNTYVTPQNPNDCLASPSCAYYIGFHNAIPSNTKPHAINTYTWASYVDDGTRLPPPFDLGAEVLSHELVEWAANRSLTTLASRVK